MEEVRPQVFYLPGLGGVWRIALGDRPRTGGGEASGLVGPSSGILLPHHRTAVRSSSFEVPVTRACEALYCFCFYSGPRWY